GQSHPDGTESEAARKCYEEALQRNPYLNAARYSLFLSLRQVDPERSARLLDEFQAFKAAEWEALSGIKYTEMGKYADVIGRDPTARGRAEIGPLPMFESPAGFKVNLAAGARWVTAADLDPPRKAAREPFGGAIVLLDFNRDGKPDLFFVAAVVQYGKASELPLRNEANL